MCFGFDGRVLINGDFDLECWIDEGWSVIVGARDEAEDFVRLWLVAGFDGGQCDGVESKGSER